jgi:uncharacterized protein
MPKQEIRTLAVGELRADSAKFQISGVAVAYNTPSTADVPAPGYTEVVMPGAFTRTLSASDADVKALWSHDPSKILGRQKNQTLQLQDTPSGLRFVIQLNKESQTHQDAFASISRGDVDAMSFGFITHKDDWDHRAKVRKVTDAELLEISCVAWPAYPQGTSAQARAVSYNVSGWGKDWEKLLADVRAAKDGITKPSLADHLRMAHECCSLALHFSTRADELIGDGEDDEDDEELRAAHRAAHEAVSLACSRFAAARIRCMA